MASPQLAFVVTDPKRLGRLESLGKLCRETIAQFFGDPLLLELIPPGMLPTHVYLGGEFCEHLLPSSEDLKAAVAMAARHGLVPVLATTVANDELIDRLGELLPLLPAEAEVVANDWGVARFVAERFPRVRLVGGRQLAKMVKDPRLPKADLGRIYPSGFGSGRQVGLLRQLGIQRLELDLPPQAGRDLFAVAGMELSVHAPFAYVAKGRICKVGSLAQPLPLKFSPGRKCNRECLGLLEAEQGSPRSPQRTFQRGTTMFYRYDPGMAEAAREAFVRGSVSRLVVSEV